MEKCIDPNLLASGCVEDRSQRWCCTKKLWLIALIISMKDASLSANNGISSLFTTLFSDISPMQSSKRNDSNQSSCQEVFSTGQCLRDYEQPPAATHQLQDPHFSLLTSGCQTVAGRSLGLCDKGHTWQTGFKYTVNNQLFHCGVVHKPLTWDTLKRDND